MRKKLSISRNSNVFGHSYQLLSEPPITLAANLEQDWTVLNRSRLPKYFWFRAPKISALQLEDTVKGLANLEDRFCFEVWQNGQVFDASLKIVDETDAETWAWSYAHYWQKWSKNQEQEWRSSINSKPRVKVNSKGQVKITVQVSTLADP